MGSSDRRGRFEGRRTWAGVLASVMTEGRGPRLQSGGRADAGFREMRPVVEEPGAPEQDQEAEARGPRGSLPAATL